MKNYKNKMRLQIIKNIKIICEKSVNLPNFKTICNSRKTRYGRICNDENS